MPVMAPSHIAWSPLQGSFPLLWGCGLGALSGMFVGSCPVFCEGVLVVSVVESFRERQVAQLDAVESLERRAGSIAELREALASQEREYALEWAAALKLDLTEGALTSSGLEAPVVPARSRRRSSRSGKPGGSVQQVESGEG